MDNKRIRFLSSRWLWIPSIILLSIVLIVGRISASMTEIEQTRGWIVSVMQTIAVLASLFPITNETFRGTKERNSNDEFSTGLMLGALISFSVMGLIVGLVMISLFDDKFFLVSSIFVSTIPLLIVTLITQPWTNTKLFRDMEQCHIDRNSLIKKTEVLKEKKTKTKELKGTLKDDYEDTIKLISRVDKAGFDSAPLHELLNLISEKRDSLDLSVQLYKCMPTISSLLDVLKRTNQGETRDLINEGLELIKKENQLSIENYSKNEHEDARSMFDSIK